MDSQALTTYAPPDTPEQPQDSTEITVKDVDDGVITPSELFALADSVLGVDTPARKMWGRMHVAKPTDSLFAMASSCGYTLKMHQVPAEVKSIFGRMERAGIPRARSLIILAGLSAPVVRATLASLLENADDKIACKAADISSKILGMQSSGHPTVNVAVQVNVAPITGEIERLLGRSNDK